jgi:threonine dehydratase
LRDVRAGRKVGLVLTGGNIGTRLTASVLTRELARRGPADPDRDRHRWPPRPARRRVGATRGRRRQHHRGLHQCTFSDLPAKGTQLEVVIETRVARIWRT